MINGIFVYLISKLISVLLRIAQRIEASNTHLDEIRNEMAELAQILSTSLVDLHKKQNGMDVKIEDLESETYPNYDVDDFDELFDQAAKIVLEEGKASASLIQRRLSIGYARAARLLDQLEYKGYVGPAEGSAPRNVLKTEIDKED
jgi:S-DNA-T family DNA segregation ATPase FtsK/SpoIIIE